MNIIPTLLFHNNEYSNKIDNALFEFNFSNFGILNIQCIHNNEMNEKDIFEEKQDNPNKHIHLSIDKSGSMDLYFNDNDNDNDNKKTKMEQLIITLKNMFNVIINKNIFISFSISLFNDDIYNLIDYIIPNKINIQSIFDLLDTIKPEGSTNFENTFLFIQKKIINLQEKNKQLDITHLFLTDGEINKGEQNINKLNELLINNDNHNHIFIGYGKNHNAILLSQLSKLNNGEYRFIDNFENSGFIYGEILSNIIYKKAKNIIIQLENGFIYNYYTNKWVNLLFINYLSSSVENRIFQIQTTNIQNLNITINGILIKKQQQQQFIFNNIQKKENINLIIYIFRQKVQEIIFDTLNGKINKHSLKKFFIYMKNYMNDNNLNQVHLMKVLCDDLYIIINTFNNKNYKKLFILSRQTSQGNQYIYNNNIFPIENEDYNDNEINNLTRQTTKTYINDNDNNSDNYNDNNSDNYNDIDYHLNEIIKHDNLEISKHNITKNENHYNYIDDSVLSIICDCSTNSFPLTTSFH